MTACQCALARLVTLEVDWPLWRDSYSSVSPTYVERDRLNGNYCYPENKRGDWFFTKNVSEMQRTKNQFLLRFNQNLLTF